MSRTRLLRLLPLLFTALVTMGATRCLPEDFGSPFFHFRAPFYHQLSETGPLDVELKLPGFGRVDGLVVTLAKVGEEGVEVAVEQASRHRAVGQIDVTEPGHYRLEAELHVRLFWFLGADLRAASSFETIALDQPEGCDILNAMGCLIPYPTSHYYGEDPTSPTGVRVRVTDDMLPEVIGEPLSVAPFAHLDGASPTVQILMHFPGGVDVEGSDAPRLLPAGTVPTAPPWFDIRTTDERSLEPDSPTLLIHARTGEQILHFVEMDARAAGNPERQLMIMRPGASLIPGERYIVAVRGLQHEDGTPVDPEPPFSVLRDLRPTTIDQLNERRRHYERSIFAPLRRAGVERSDLILAFDFVVQSEQALTSEMLHMRDESFAWVEDELAAGHSPFSVESEEIFDCSDPDQSTWKIVRGRFEVPLYLTEDPEIDTSLIGFLNHAPGTRTPEATGITEPPFTISLPCTALDPSGPVPHPVVIGHGLFGTGEGMIESFADGLGFDYISGATNWRGLSGQRDAGGISDLEYILFRTLGVGSSQLNNIASLPDRLLQGQLNTLVLAKLMKLGAFNGAPEFQRSPGEGVFPGPGAEMFYYGISLGGIMGTMFSALTPDVERLQLDVPSINFGILLQRSTQFGAFEIPLAGIGLSDPADQLLGLGLIHELWVRSDPAGYARHITGLVEDPLPGTNPKKILMTVAWLDKQVSNQGSEIMARTLGIPNLDGSVQQGLQGIEDVSGPVDSALVIWDAGSFDIFDPAYESVIPPLANLIPSNKCDPHARRLTIPAALEQTSAFLRPGGQVENFCSGVCDADGPFERPGGVEEVCDPLS